MEKIEKYSLMIAKAREDDEQRRLDALPMDQWWDVIRERTVKPVLTFAARALAKAGLHGVVLPKNGSALLLRTGANERSPHRHLTFRLSGEAISIESSEDGLAEIWDDRSHVTEENIDKKIEQFIQQIVKS